MRRFLLGQRDKCCFTSLDDGRAQILNPGFLFCKCRYKQTKFTFHVLNKELAILGCVLQKILGSGSDRELSAAQYDPEFKMVDVASTSIRYNSQYS